MGELEEVPIRVRRYFLTPCEKWNNGRRPFKLITQIFKIIIVTTQIYRFGSITQDTVEFQNDVETAVWRILNFDQDNLISTQNEYYNKVFNVRKGLYILRTASLANLTDISDITISFAKILSLDNETYTLSNYSTDESFDESYNYINTTVGPISLNLEEHEICTMKFSTNLMHLDQYHKSHTKNNYAIDYTLTIDNSDHSGLASFGLDQYLYSSDERNVHVDTNLLCDLLTLIFTLLSLSLVTRSLYRAQKLRRRFQEWHQAKFGNESSSADNSSFIDGWYIIIFISDLAICIGTILKIDAQSRTYAGLDAFQNSCSFLGIGCLLVYCGILRYLGYFKGYNILVLTISTAMPNVLKFLSCALTLYTGYALCGWLVLGPFNEKFRTLTITSETLFSLLNGDDMFNTFQLLRPSGPFIFSQFYLYSFICVFIYVVLSLFISVVMDSYETIKANKGERSHSAGIRAALDEECENSVFLNYQDTTSCAPGCNICCFLFNRNSEVSRSSSDQSLLETVGVNLDSSNQAVATSSNVQDSNAN
jgi:mucolipin 3